MDLFKKLKALIDGQDRKKLIENTIIVIIVGIIIIIAGSALFNGGSANSDRESANNPAKAALQDTAQSVQSTAEERLKLMLSQIKGVGRADVMITYKTSSENVPASDIKKSQNSTREKDNEGGVRDITQEDYESTIVYEDSSAGGKKPVILKKIEPEVKGVLIVADGADSAEVRERICEAVMVVLDVPAHKVHVETRKR